ncbi:putative mitochondrion protein [Powellomyces hirtus]|nr:putative mitochondrion protein [Powellomyces hirtus]
MSLAVSRAATSVKCWRGLIPLRDPCAFLVASRRTKTHWGIVGTPASRRPPVTPVDTADTGRRLYSGVHQFDTYRLVQRLEGDGFSRESAEAVMASLSEVVSESINNISRTSVTKSDFEKAIYTNKVDFAHVRNEIQMLEKNDFALLRSDIGRLNTEVEKFRTRMVEDLRRVQSNVRLELSLEKGRIRDEQSAQELRIKEADSQIDTEVATLRTQMETIQWELFKTLFPLFCAAGALFFSYLRFVK